MPSQNTDMSLAERRTSKKGRDRRHQIIETAKQRLVAQGMEGLVLREIANDLGIAHSNVQYYFQTKGDLLEALYDEEIYKYKKNLEIFVGSSSTTAGKISAMVDSIYDSLADENTRLWRILTGIANKDDELGRILKRQVDFYDQAVASALTDIAPHLSDSRLLEIAKIARIILDGLVVEFIFEDPGSPGSQSLKNEIKIIFNNLLDIS